MRIWSPSASPVTTTRRCAVLSSMVKTWKESVVLSRMTALRGTKIGVLAARQQHAGGGEHARPQFAFRIIEARFQDEDARVRVHRRVDGGHLPVKSRSG